MDPPVEHVLAQFVRPVIRKIDARLMPFIFVLEFCSYLNRVCMAYAKNSGLKTDLALSPTEDALAVSFLYLAYFLFSIPSVLLLRRIGATIYLSMIMLVWGSVSIGSAFVTNGLQLIVVRFLLGMAVAGFFPGMTLFLSLWYRKNERTMRIVIFHSGVTLSSAVGGILGYAIDKMDGLGHLNGWQWIFLALGIPIVILGVITFFFLDNIPETVQWLSPMEKEILTNILRDPADIDPDELIEERRIQCGRIASIFRDQIVWLYALITFANLSVIKYWVIYFPSLIQAIGYKNLPGQLMAIPPFFMACMCALLGGWSATKNKEHGYHVMFFLALSSIGFVLMGALAGISETAVYISACVACCGAYPAFALLMAWLASSMRGHMRKALTVGLAVAVGQIGGIVFPFIHYDDKIDTFRRAHIICAVTMAMAVLFTFLLRFLLNRPRHVPQKNEQDGVL